MLVLVVEYFVVPQLVGAFRDVHLLREIRPAWGIAGLGFEAASLVSYALLTRSLLTPPRPRLSRLFRITLATTGASHVLPASAVAGPGFAVQLLTAEGVAVTDAGFVVVAEALYSAVVLNALLWLALLASIPLAGTKPVYLAVAVVGAVLMLAAALLFLTFTRGEDHAVRVVRWVGGHVRWLGADRLETAVRRVADLLTRLTGSRATLGWATLWAALNWLLDAAALGTFLAAFGHPLHPALLCVAYGIGNVLAAIPVTPGGLGIVEASTASLLVGFGVRGTVATLAVLAWRLVEFWLPIPVGGLAYVSLRLPPGARWRQWLRERPGPFGRRGDTEEKESTDDDTRGNAPGRPGGGAPGGPAGDPEAAAPGEGAGDSGRGPA